MQHQNNQEVSPIAESIHYMVSTTDTPEAVRLAPSIHEMNYRAAMTALENVKVERDRLHDRGFHHICEAYNGSETFVEGGQKAQAVLSLLDTQPAAGADVLDAKRWRYAMDWDTKDFAVCRRAGATGTCWEPIKTDGPIDAAIAASGRQE